MTNKALVVVDVLNDFMPGGSLPVPDGDKIFSALNKMIDYGEKNDWLVIICRDSHLQESIDCKKYGQHAIRNTLGADLHPDLKINEDAAITIFKGLGLDEYGHSGFTGINADGLELGEILRSKNIEVLYISGVATEICVKETVLDAIKFGFKVKVLSDAIAPFNDTEGEKALYEMMKGGAIIISVYDIIMSSYR